MNKRSVNYAWILALILELSGFRPRLDCNQEWAEMLRRAGWRPFMLYHFKG